MTHPATHSLAAHASPIAGLTPAPIADSHAIDLDVVVTRSGEVESRHRVHAAIVDFDGNVLHAAHDPHVRTWWRSCAKPFQVLPFVRERGLERLGWGDDELALACASHGGEPEHVALAESMLASLGLEEGDLACGPHEPLASRGAKLLRESGRRVTRLHNNCSGKHAAMLARAVAHGWSTKGYERADHAVQQGALDSVAEWTGLSRSEIGVGIDGCGVTVFALPLDRMAYAYARFVRAARLHDAEPRRIVRAMTTHPFLIGGSDRFDTALMQAFGGRVVCKVGAEGVHTLALVERGIGIAIKVEDGAPRAQYPAVIAALAALGEHPDAESPRASGPGAPSPLREFVVKPIRNTRNEVVGAVHVSSASSSA